MSKQLLVQLACGEPGLPPLGNIEGNTAGRVRVYLRGIPFWVQLKEQCAQKNEDISPYSFRHRYAYELDARGFNDRHASSFMGNTREVFAHHYGNKAREDKLKPVADALLKAPASFPAKTTMFPAAELKETRAREPAHSISQDVAMVRAPSESSVKWERFLLSCNA